MTRKDSPVWEVFANLSGNAFGCTGSLTWDSLKGPANCVALAICGVQKNNIPARLEQLAHLIAELASVDSDGMGMMRQSNGPQGAPRQIVRTTIEIV